MLRNVQRRNSRNNTSAIIRTADIAIFPPLFREPALQCRRRVWSCLSIVRPIQRRLPSPDRLSMLSIRRNNAILQRQQSHLPPHARNDCRDSRNHYPPVVRQRRVTRRIEWPPLRCCERNPRARLFVIHHVVTRHSAIAAQVKIAVIAVRVIRSTCSGIHRGSCLLRLIVLRQIQRAC